MTTWSASSLTPGPFPPTTVWTGSCDPAWPSMVLLYSQHSLIQLFPSPQSRRSW